METETPLDTSELDAVEIAKDEGPMPTLPANRQKWIDWCNEYPNLRLLSDIPWNEPHLSRQLDRDSLACLLGSVLNGEHRQILQEVLLDLLGDGIEKIILAVLRREDE